MEKQSIPSFITVRTGSTRLPEKCFLSFGKGSVLEHVILRALHYGLEPIVCTTYDRSDDEIEKLADRLGVKCFRGPSENKLLRWSQCCQYFGLESFHSVDADDPFFCGDEVRRSFELLQNGLDMVTPSPSSSGGGATVGYSLTSDIVLRASEGLSDDAETEMMWSYIELIPDLKKATLPDPVENIIKVRMTLDYHEDYILLEAVRLLVGPLATRADVAKLFQDNPDMERINAFRTDEWGANQKAKSL